MQLWNPHFCALSDAKTLSNAPHLIQSVTPAQELEGRRVLVNRGVQFGCAL